MRLPAATATTGPPRESGLARAGDIGALTRTGDVSVWRGVSRAGGAIRDVAGLAFGAYQERKALDDEIRWGQGTQKTEEALAELGEAAENTDFKIDEPLPGSPDYYKSPLALSVEKKERLVIDALAESDKRAKEIEQSFPTREGKEKYKLWYGKRRLRFEASIRHNYGAKHDEYQIDRLDKLWQAAAANGDAKTAESYIDAMDRNELITPAQATARKEQITEIANRSLLNQIWDTAKEMPYAEAVKFVNDMPGLERADRNDLITRIKRLNDINTATTNRKVRWDTLLKATKDPESVTDDYLESLVKPNSLTWDDAEEIRKIRDTPNHALKRPVIQRGFKTLDTLQSLQIQAMRDAENTPQEIREAVLVYLDYKNDLENFVRREERTDDEIEKKIQVLTREKVKEISLSFFEKLMVGFVFSKEELAEKRMKKLETTYVWDELTEEDKRVIRQAFIQGKTVEEVLRLREGGE